MINILNNRIELGFVEEHKLLVEQDKNYKYISSYKELTNFKKSKNYYKTYFIVQCLYCKNIESKEIGNWKNGHRTQCCCKHYENSIAYYIECELGLNLYDIWNWKENDKNGVNPYYTYKSCKTEIWLYCQKHDYHNYNKEDIKIGYKTNCNHFHRGRRCPYCASNKTHWKDSLKYIYPDISKLISIPINNLTEEECLNILPNSSKKVYYICPNCKKQSDNANYIYNLTKHGLSCNYCFDNISIPNKMLR